MRLRVAEPARVSVIHQTMLRAAAAAAAASVEQYVKECETWAQGVFASAGLPQWQRFVRCQANGRWVDDLLQGDLETLRAQLRSDEWCETLGGIINREYGSKSKERYAYDLFGHLSRLQRAWTADDTDGALRALHGVHVTTGLARIVLDWEADALVGRRMQKSVRQGGQTRAHQRRADHQERLAVWRPAAERLRQAHPTWSKRAIARHISKQTGDSLHTIRKNI